MQISGMFDGYGTKIYVLQNDITLRLACMYVRTTRLN